MEVARSRRTREGANAQGPREARQAHLRSTAWCRKRSGSSRKSWKPDSVRAGELDADRRGGLSADSPHAHPRVRAAVRRRACSHLARPQVRQEPREPLRRPAGRRDRIRPGRRRRSSAGTWRLWAITRGRWFAGNKGWKEATADAPMPLGFAFEVDQTAYELPAGTPPAALVHARLHLQGPARSSTGIPTSGWTTGRNGNRSNASKLANCMAQQY